MRHHTLRHSRNTFVSTSVAYIGGLPHHTVLTLFSPDGLTTVQPSSIPVANPNLSSTRLRGGGAKARSGLEFISFRLPGADMQLLTSVRGSVNNSPPFPLESPLTTPPSPVKRLLGHLAFGWSPFSSLFDFLHDFQRRQLHSFS